MTLMILTQLCAAESDTLSKKAEVEIVFSAPVIELDDLHMPWIWQSGHFYQAARRANDGKLVEEDTVSVYLYNPDEPEKIDIWVWRAERSRITSLAEDMHAQLEKNASDSKIIPIKDAGTLPWRVYRPYNFEGNKLSRYKYDLDASGSASDVAASYSYSDGLLNVIFRRAKDTENDDDIKIISGKTMYAVTFIPPGKTTLADLEFNVYNDNIVSSSNMEVPSK